MSIINDFTSINKDLKKLTGDHVWPEGKDWLPGPCTQQEKCEPPGMPSGASPTQPFPTPTCKPGKAIGYCSTCGGQGYYFIEDGHGGPVRVTCDTCHPVPPPFLSHS